MLFRHCRGWLNAYEHALSIHEPRLEISRASFESAPNLPRASDADVHENRPIVKHRVGHKDNAMEYVFCPAATTNMAMYSTDNFVAVHSLQISYCVTRARSIRVIIIACFILKERSAEITTKADASCSRSA